MSTLNAYNGMYELEFERPLTALERQIAELETSQSAPSPGLDFASEVRKLRQSHTAMLKKIYANLNAWNTVKVARHPGRPQAIDYIRNFVKDFAELHGDRRFGDDPAIISGFGRIGSHKCLVIAHNKGKDTRERIACHFGCAHPEGYRKALRCMKLAEKFKLPVVTLIDTPGAYPGIGAEERGQAEAIAVNLREMANLKTPIVCAVIGEGASGGALGIGVGDRLAMMQYAWYSVISPEGCAAILWKTATPDTNAAAADALKLTAADNLKYGTIDHVIDEPLGGAHRNPAAAADQLEKWLTQTLRELKRQKIENLMHKRYERLRSVGAYENA
ncbi:acetyl-CoA carboxylase carboxyltransferase subunit alpha [Phycisphaerales bacterium AB-hyl4]|uniref:Acetyl-coenzyme A carboxylase carboxyl transferase subunit alpha n=1 Tax=Natronomicrosphaera hydrolytica TaxID=3242702 RepID=A0ABV4U0N1_9BACT